MQSSFYFESKARTLSKLSGLVHRFSVPELEYFTVEEWVAQPEALIRRLQGSFEGRRVIVRSSAAGEDDENWARAGQYASVPDVPLADPEALTAAIQTVVESYDRVDTGLHAHDEVIVQEMLSETIMSGVLFTHDLNTGAPYYVINYDDESGRTDTVTAGNGEHANRTLYAHRGSSHALRSPRFRALLDAVGELEEITGNQFLDIEFALGPELQPYLLQVRLISTRAHWNTAVRQQVDEALKGARRLMELRMSRMAGIRGSSSVLGQMPDWNPAEMIGRAPRRLAASLYRRLITDRVWRDARKEMGYAAPVGHPLMLMMAGQPYIDARLSFNSYLSSDLDETIGEKLVNGWLDRLKANPHLHDKVEFDVAITTWCFDLDAEIDRLVPSVLTSDEREAFTQSLLGLTRELIAGDSLSTSLERTRQLDQRNRNRTRVGGSDLAGVRELLEECAELGTTPFSIQARHGFVARSLLLSLVRLGVITKEEADAFSLGIQTVAGEIVADLRRLASGKLPRDEFMEVYGHLRPGTYDILSPRYDQARGLLDNIQATGEPRSGADFEPSAQQLRAIDDLLCNAGLDSISSSQLLDYIRRATAAREFGKFVFTRTLSDVLECIADYGTHHGLSRDQLSHVSLEALLQTDIESHPDTPADRLGDLAEEGRQAHAAAVATRLPQVLFDVEGVDIVPFQVSHPNFITQGTIRAPCVRIDSSVGVLPSLAGKVMLVENADPGFDWLFAHDVGGLVTKFGGANSHMAIRCAEFGIPAAIGCGEQIFESLVASGGVEMNCGEGQLRPVRF